MNFCCHDNYTKTGEHDPLDVNILNAYVQYLQSTGNVPPQDIPTFLTFYEGKVGSGAVAGLGNKTIKHLPSLEADTQVITDGGLVDKCDTGASCTCSAVVEGTVLKVDFDASKLTGGNDHIKGVEIVFDNVEFTEKTGLSGGTATINDNFKDTNNAATLDFYYDYSIRTTSVADNPTEPNKTKSVIGFIDTTENGTGATKGQIGQIQFSVTSDSFTMTGNEPILADVRVYDSSPEVVQYGITRCEG